VARQIGPGVLISSNLVAKLMQKWCKIGAKLILIPSPILKLSLDEQSYTTKEDVRRKCL